MRAWLLLLGTFAEAVIVASVAAYALGLWACAVICLVGGWCIAQRDHNYQASQAAREQ